MATYIPKEGTGTWGTAASWYLETWGGSTASVQPTASDDILFMEKSGKINASSAAPKCRSIKFEAGSAGKLSITSNIAVGTTSAPAGSFALICIPSCIEDNGGNVSLNSTSAAGEVEVKSEGNTFNGVTFNGNLGKWKLADKLKVKERLTFTKGTLKSNNQEVSCERIVHESTGASEANFESSLVKVQAIQWTGSNGVLNAKNAKFEVPSGSGSTQLEEVIEFGEYIASGTIAFEGFGANHAVTVGTLNIKNDVSLQSEMALTVTTIVTDARPGSKHKITGSTSSKIKKTSGNVVLDFLEIEKVTAEGGAKFYVGPNGTDLGGNSGWLFPKPMSLSL